MDEKLDLCKYCEHSVLIDQTEDGNYFIECTGCDLTTASFPIRNQLVRYWNYKSEDGKEKATKETLKELENIARETQKDVALIKFIAQNSSHLKELPPA